MKPRANARPVQKTVHHHLCCPPALYKKITRFIYLHIHGEPLSSFIWHVSLCPNTTLPRLWASLPASCEQIPLRMWLESPVVIQGESKDTAWDLQKLSLGSNSATPALQHHAVTALHPGPQSWTWAQYSLVWIGDISPNSQTSGDTFGTAGVKNSVNAPEARFAHQDAAT